MEMMQGILFYSHITLWRPLGKVNLKKIYVCKIKYYFTKYIVFNDILFDKFSHVCLCRCMNYSIPGEDRT